MDCDASTLCDSRFVYVPILTGLFLLFCFRVGAQVGESSILTRAALTVANSYRDIVVTQEGAFGTFLLERDICQPSLMFGAAGRLEAEMVGGKPGLGLERTVA